MKSFDEIREALLARAEKAEAKAARLAALVRGYMKLRIPPTFTVGTVGRIVAEIDAARAAVASHGDLAEGGAA